MYSTESKFPQITVQNNFAIAKLWKYFKENSVHTSILLPFQMNDFKEKWAFRCEDLNLDIKKLENELNLNQRIEPIEFTADFSYIDYIKYQEYSIKNCLDWLISNLEDDQWLLDDFRGYNSKLLDSRYPAGLSANYWSNPKVAIYFKKHEDLNLFKVLKENFKDPGYAN